MELINNGETCDWDQIGTDAFKNCNKHFTEIDINGENITVYHPCKYNQ